MRFRSSTLQPPSLPFSALRLEPEHRDLEDHPVTAGCLGDRILLLHESERVLKTTCRLRLPTSQPNAAEPPEPPTLAPGDPGGQPLTIAVEPAQHDTHVMRNGRDHRVGRSGRHISPAKLCLMRSQARRVKNGGVA